MPGTQQTSSVETVRHIDFSLMITKPIVNSAKESRLKALNFICLAVLTTSIEYNIKEIVD